MASFISKILVTLLIYIFSPIFILTFTAVATLRYIVSKIVPMINPGIGKILTTKSSSPGTDKIYKAPMMTLVTVSTYEGTIDLSILRNEFESRVIFARDKAGNLLRPELRQYLTRRCGFTFWKDDPNFSIDHHVRLYDGSFQKIYTQADHITAEMVIGASEELLYGPFLAKKSPWEMLVFHNYKDSPESPISTALALRIHHSLADGFSILDITTDLLNEKIEKSKHPPQHASNYFLTICRGLRLLVLGPYEFISKTLDADDDPVWKIKEDDLTRNFNFGVSPIIPLQQIREVGQIANASFTAVILECFTGALRRFMKEAGHEIPKQIHCVTPLPVPGHPTRKMRNHMTACLTPLPVGMNNPISRLRKIDNDLLKLRRSTYPATIFTFMSIFVGSLFRCMIKPFSVNNMTTAMMSNFPGPVETMAFNGHTLLSSYFSGGLFRGTCAMGFSALSCSGNIRFVFAVNNVLVHTKTLPASQLVNYFFEELEVIKRDSIV